MDLSHLIARNAAFTPDRPAIHFEGATLSYAAFNARIETTAKALKSECGVGRGDRVAILSLNRPDYLVLLSTIGGINALGLNGFVVGPVIAALFVAGWTIFAKLRKGEDVAHIGETQSASELQR